MLRCLPLNITRNEYLRDVTDKVVDVEGMSRAVTRAIAVRPVRVAPGTTHKLAVLTRRWELGLPLFIDEDEQDRLPTCYGYTHPTDFKEEGHEDQPAATYPISYERDDDDGGAIW